MPASLNVEGWLMLSCVKRHATSNIEVRIFPVHGKRHITIVKKSYHWAEIR